MTHSNKIIEHVANSILEKIQTNKVPSKIKVIYLKGGGWFVFFRSTRFVWRQRY